MEPMVGLCWAMLGYLSFWTQALVWIAGTGLLKRTERLKQKQVWRGSETESNGIQRDSEVS